MEISVAVDSSSPPPWIELPEDLTANILQRLGVDEILVSAETVCTSWRRVCHNPAMWRVIHIKNAGYVYNYYQLDVMSRISVDRSQGQMIDLSIDTICDDELLNYTVQRSSGLRCLTLNCCFRISGKGLIKAVEKLEHLEELHLIHLEVDAGDVETIGVSCPMLKSFTLNKCFSRNSDFALAIAKTMTNLIHLRLVQHSIKKEALEAILDCCSHLELLDLQGCVGLELQGDLAKRCSEQIKDLILPFYIGSEYDSLYQAWHLYNHPITCKYIGRCDVYDFNHDSYFNDDDDDDDDFYHGSYFDDDFYRDSYLGDDDMEGDDDDSYRY